MATIYELIDTFLFIYLFIEGDALYLPFPVSLFDAITMGYGLRNVVDKRKAMPEMFRVLKKGLIFLSCIAKLSFDISIDTCSTYLFLLDVSGFRVSILDFNKSIQITTVFIQVTLK